MAETTTRTTSKPVKRGRKADTFTKSEITFLKEMAGGSTQVAAAQKAWPNQSYNSAAVTASETLKKPKIQDALAQVYEASGITPQAIADVLSDAMLAKKSFQDNGQLVLSDIPDHAIRVNAARTAANLIMNKDNGDGGNGPTINFNVNSTQNYIKNVDVTP